MPAVGLSFFRHEHRSAKIARIGSRTRSEDQFLYAKVQYILVPLTFSERPLTTFALATALVVYHVYHTHDLSQRRYAHGSLLIKVANNFADNRKNGERELCLNAVIPFSMVACCLVVK